MLKTIQKVNEVNKHYELKNLVKCHKDPNTLTLTEIYSGGI